MERNGGIWADKILAERRPSTRFDTAQTSIGKLGTHHLDSTLRANLLAVGNWSGCLLLAAYEGRAASSVTWPQDKKGMVPWGNPCAPQNFLNECNNKPGTELATSPLADSHLVSQLRVSLIPPKIVPHLACPADHPNKRTAVVVQEPSH